MLKTFLLVAFSFLCSHLQAEPLASAEQLAENLRTNQWTYQFLGKPALKQIDCTQFVAKVISSEIGRPLTDLESDAINIRSFDGVTVQPVLETGTDSRVDGPVYALVTIMHKANTIQPSDAKAGDIIQYWIKKSDVWAGHCGIISSVSSSGYATIYGAHLTPGPQGHFGPSAKAINLFGSDRRIAIARIK